VKLAEDKLFVELAKSQGGWLWCNDRIDNKPETILGCCLGGFVVEKQRVGWGILVYCEAVPVALCDLLLWMRIDAEVGCHLAPSSFWIRGIWGNLSCGSWYHCHGTHITEA
jgi:hypothetical protein